MATLAEIGRARRGDFRRLLQASRALDASQEKVEREIKRLVARKKAVPETEDARRIITLLGGVTTSITAMNNLMSQIVKNWGTT